MARRVFFSFHYDNDVWRANVVRNSNVVLGADTAGFFDHSEYEEAKKKGDGAIRKMIDDNLRGTSVTVILIGSQTYNRPWVQYEVKKSLEQKNGLLGIHIHAIKNQLGLTSFQGPLPTVPYGTDFPSYTWDYDAAKFKKAIEAAGLRSDVLRSKRS